MKRFALLSTALAVSLTATAAGAQEARPLGEAFMIGLKACIAIEQGQLALNPPSQAQTDAGLVLADPTAPDELIAFSDLSPSARLFAAVNATGGSVVVAHDPSQSLCRVVVFDAADISPVTAAVGPLGGDWVVKLDDPIPNFTIFTGTILGSPKFTIRTRQPPAGSGYGSANYLLTLLPAS